MTVWTSVCSVIQRRKTPFSLGDRFQKRNLRSKMWQICDEFLEFVHSAVTTLCQLEKYAERTTTQTPSRFTNIYSSWRCITLDNPYCLHPQSLRAGTSKLGTVPHSQVKMTTCLNLDVILEGFALVSMRQTGSFRQTLSSLAWFSCSHKIQYIHNQTVVSSTRGSRT